MEHLTTKFIDKMCERLWTVRGSLGGVGGLFTQGTKEVSFDDGEFYGIGLLLKKLGDELGAIEDLLRCGKDSMADRRNGLEIEDEDDGGTGEFSEKILILAKEIFKTERKLRATATWKKCLCGRDSFSH